jgi:hypothetical protein
VDFTYLGIGSRRPNGLNKVGLKEFNKKCKDITTKEQLVNYLNSIK